MKHLYWKILLCVVMGTVLALTSHMYISDWAKPLIAEMTAGLMPPTEGYSSHIIVAAYGTAFITVSLIVFLYYQAGHLLNIPNRVIKAIILAAIILEIKGDLFRQPVMDYMFNFSLGMKNPIVFVFLNQIDKWVANLLLALVLVFLCPTKHKIVRS